MSVLRRVLSAVALLCSLAATALALVLVLVPLVTDAVPLTVLTGSMAPVHGPGDIVVVRPVPAEELRVGDVITFEAGEADDRLITHRIEATGVDAAGEPAFVTRGDANPVPDAEPVLAGQVRGRSGTPCRGSATPPGPSGPTATGSWSAPAWCCWPSGCASWDSCVDAPLPSTRPARPDDAGRRTSSATAHGGPAAVA